MNVYRKWPGTALSLVLKGDEAAARRLVPRARVGIGYLFDTMREWQSFRQMTLRGQDGSWMKLSAWRTAQGEKAKAEIFTPLLLGEDAFIYINGFLLYPQDVDGGIGKRFLEVAYENRDDALVLIKPLALADKPKLNAAPVTWCSERLAGPDKNGIIVSYDHGLPTRYRLWPSQDCSGRVRYLEGQPYIVNAGKPGVFLWGKEIGTSYTKRDEQGNVVYSCSLNVVGAAVYDSWLVIVSHMDPDVNQKAIEGFDQYDIARANCNTASLFAAPVDLVKKSIKPFEFVAKYQVETFMKSPWFFSPSGAEACTLYEEGPAASPAQHKITIALAKVDGAVQAVFSIEELQTEQFYLDILEDPEELFRESYNGTYVGSGMSPIPSTQWDKVGLVYNGEEYEVDVEQVVNKMAKDVFGYWYPDAEYPYPGLDMDCYYSLGWLGDDPDPCINGDCSRHEFTGWAISLEGGPGIPEYVDGYPVPGKTYVAWMTWPGGHGTTAQLVMRRQRFNGSKSKVALNYKRGVEGKRYITFDYNPDGNLVEVVLKLKDDGLQHATYHYAEDSRIVTFKNLIDPFTTVKTRSSEMEYSSRGMVSWVLEVDGEEMFSVDGGLVGSYSRRYKDDNGNQSYGPGPCKLVTERSWLIDLDARYKIGAIEKIRMEMTPDEPAAWDSQRLSGYATRKAVLEVFLDGARIKKENLLQEDYFLSPWISTAHLELFPRFYPVADQVEEFAILSAIDAPYGNEAGRIWGIDLEYGDRMPFRGVLGQIQSRFEDFIVSVTNTSTSLSLAMEGEIPYAPKEYIYRSYINDNPYDFVTECKKIKDFSEEFTVVPVSAL